MFDYSINTLESQEWSTMYIQAIKFLNNWKINNQDQPRNREYLTGSLTQTKLPIFFYKDYNINFGARLNRTPENFYAQQFNIDNMPDTVKKYLYEDFDTRHHMPPAQLQRQAFEYLKLADTIQDIKDMYPDEPLFANLRELKDTKPNTGILLLLKWDAQTSQTPVFKDKNNKDLTTYLLKKVYLEGKTLDEINKDFDNDATDAIKRELGVKDKQYFCNSNMRTLGIRYPNLPYYNSFLATRNDKEYIPPVRKSGITPSQETRDKLSEAMTKWWAGLNEMERSEQIQKMLNGKEMSNSIFSKYQGQIMTIAAAQMGFSEKLSDIFAEKYSDENFTIDFPEFSEQQREIMLEFWNKDPEFRTKYSQTLQDTIAEFENAYYSKDKTHLEQLLNKALDLKAKVLDKARAKQHTKREMQKLARPAETVQPKLPEISNKNIHALFRQQTFEAMEFFTDTFQKEMFEFLTKNISFKTKQKLVMLNQPNAGELLNLNDEDFDALKAQMKKQTEELNQQFDFEHTLTAKTNDFILNNQLYKLTGDPKVFKFERDDAVSYIKEHNLQQKILTSKNEMNKNMKTLLKEYNSFKSAANTNSLNMNAKNSNIKNFIENEFNKAAVKRFSEGFRHYTEIPAHTLDKMNLALTSLTFNNNDTNKFILNNYAVIDFISNPKNHAEARDVALEHLILDHAKFVMNFAEKYPQRIENKNEQNKDTLSSDYLTVLHEKLGITGTYSDKKSIMELERNYNIDFDSIDSLVFGLQQYLHKNETKYWVPQVENEFLDSVPKLNALNKEFLQIFCSMHCDKYNKLIRNRNPKDQKIMYDLNKTFETMLHENFENAKPQTANANHAALNYILYALTQNPEMLTNTPVQTAAFIKANYLGKRVSDNKEQISRKYNEYLNPLSQDEIRAFYSSTFYPKLINIFETGLKYETIDKNINNLRNFDEVEVSIVNSLKNNDRDMITKVNKYLTDKSAFIKLINENQISAEGKDRIIEKLVADFERKITVERNKTEN